MMTIEDVTRDLKIEKLKNQIMILEMEKLQMENDKLKEQIANSKKQWMKKAEQELCLKITRHAALNFIATRWRNKGIEQETMTMGKNLSTALYSEH